MQHLFFDLDRTLWDFEKNSELALHELFHSIGLDRAIPEFELFHSSYKLKNAELWKQYGAGKISKDELRISRFKITLESFGVDDPNLISQMSDGYVEISPRQTALFPGALATLLELKTQGYPMHIITNGFKEVQYIKLENSGLAPFFDVVICSEEVGKNKPSPDIFHFALSKAKATSSHSVMIGDDPEVDVYGALSAGMRGILFDPYEENKGFVDVPRITALSEIPGMLPWIFRP
jgi:putative hydrolase of the HAD superfamily